jgi:hypothetical protein
LIPGDMPAGLPSGNFWTILLWFALREFDAIRAAGRASGGRIRRSASTGSRRSFSIGWTGFYL